MQLFKDLRKTFRKIVRTKINKVRKQKEKNSGESDNSGNDLLETMLANRPNGPPPENVSSYTDSSVVLNEPNDSFPVISISMNAPIANIVIAPGEVRNGDSIVRICEVPHQLLESYPICTTPAPLTSYPTCPTPLPVYPICSVPMPKYSPVPVISAPASVAPVPYVPVPVMPTAPKLPLSVPTITLDLEAVVSKNANVAQLVNAHVDESMEKSMNKVHISPPPYQVADVSVNIVYSPRLVNILMGSTDRVQEVLTVQTNDVQNTQLVPWHGSPNTVQTFIEPSIGVASNGVGTNGVLYLTDAGISVAQVIQPQTDVVLQTNIVSQSQLRLHEREGAKSKMKRKRLKDKEGEEDESDDEREAHTPECMDDGIEKMISGHYPLERLAQNSCKEMIYVCKEITCKANIVHAALAELASRIEIDISSSSTLNKPYQLNFQSEAFEGIRTVGLRAQATVFLKHIKIWKNANRFEAKWVKRIEKGKEAEKQAKLREEAGRAEVERIKLETKRVTRTVLERVEQESEQEREAVVGEYPMREEVVGGNLVHVTWNRTDILTFMNNFPELHGISVKWYELVSRFAGNRQCLWTDFDPLFQIVVPLDLWNECKLTIGWLTGEPPRDAKGGLSSTVKDYCDKVINFLKGKVSARDVDWLKIKRTTQGPKESVHEYYERLYLTDAGIAVAQIIQPETNGVPQLEAQEREGARPKMKERRVGNNAERNEDSDNEREREPLSSEHIDDEIEKIITGYYPMERLMQYTCREMIYACKEITRKVNVVHAALAALASRFKVDLSSCATLNKTYRLQMQNESEFPGEKEMSIFMLQFVLGLCPEICNQTTQSVTCWQGKLLEQYANYCSDELESKQKKIKEKFMLAQTKLAQQFSGNGKNNGGMRGLEVQNGQQGMNYVPNQIRNQGNRSMNQLINGGTSGANVQCTTGVNGVSLSDLKKVAACLNCNKIGHSRRVCKFPINNGQSRDRNNIINMQIGQNKISNNVQFQNAQQNVQDMEFPIAPMQIIKGHQMPRFNAGNVNMQIFLHEEQNECAFLFLLLEITEECPFGSSQWQYLEESCVLGQSGLYIMIKVCGLHSVKIGNDKVNGQFVDSNLGSVNLHGRDLLCKLNYAIHCTPDGVTLQTADKNEPRLLCHLEKGQVKMFPVLVNEAIPEEFRETVNERVLPQEYTESPSIFNEALKKNLESVVLPYKLVLIQCINNSSLASKSREARKCDSVALLNFLAKNGHEVSQAKMQFCIKEVKYLGQLTLKGMRKIAPERVDAILKMNIPMTQKEVRMFLGMVGYCKQWLPTFPEIAKPLIRLIKKVVTDHIELQLNEIKAFLELKKEKWRTTALGIPDYEKTFFLFVKEQSESRCALPTQKHGADNCTKRCNSLNPATLLPVSKNERGEQHEQSNEQPNFENFENVLNKQYDLQLQHKFEAVQNVQHFENVEHDYEKQHYFEKQHNFENVHHDFEKMHSFENALNFDSENAEMKQDCLDVTELHIKPRPDIRDTPLEKTEIVLLINDGVLCAAYVICTLGQIIEAFWLSEAHSAQVAEIPALIRACEISAHRAVIIYTDAQCGFGIIQQGGFLTAAEIPICNGEYVKGLLDALQRPSKMTIVICLEHQKSKDFVSIGNTYTNYCARYCAMMTTQFNIRLDEIEPEGKSAFSMVLCVCNTWDKLKQVQNAVSENEKLGWMKSACKQNNFDIWVSADRRPVLPKSLIFPMTRYYHEQAHIGRDTMINQFRKTWFCSKFRVSAETFFQRYITCQQMNAGKKTYITQSHIGRLAGSFKRVQIDYLEMPSPNRLRYILMLMCLFSRWVEAFSTRRCDSLSVEKLQLRKIIPRFVMPESVKKERAKLQPPDEESTMRSGEEIQSESPRSTASSESEKEPTPRTSVRSDSDPKSSGSESRRRESSPIHSVLRLRVQRGKVMESLNNQSSESQAESVRNKGVSEKDLDAHTACCSYQQGFSIRLAKVKTNERQEQKAQTELSTPEADSESENKGEIKKLRIQSRKYLTPKWTQYAFAFQINSDSEERSGSGEPDCERKAEKT